MENKVKQNIKTILIKGILAGFFIGIASMLSTVVSSSVDNYSLSKLLSGLVFPIGLILVVLFKTELFTGNMLVIIPLINKEVSLKDSLKLLIFSYIGNFIGTLILVLLVNSTNHFSLVGNSYINIAMSKINLNSLNAFILGLLCNILVCSAVYLANNSKTYVEKVLSCFFPVFTFVVLGFEHSIANMFYLFIGYSFERNLLSSSISLYGIFNNLLFVTLGNIIGGLIIGIVLSYIKKDNQL